MIQKETLRDHREHKQTFHAPYSFANTASLPVTERDKRALGTSALQFLGMTLGHESFGIGPMARIAMDVPADKAERSALLDGIPADRRICEHLTPDKRK